jgi:hypothetical protein
MLAQQEVGIASSPLVFLVTGFLSFFSTMFIVGFSASGILTCIQSRQSLPVTEEGGATGKVISTQTEDHLSLRNDSGIGLDEVVIDGAALRHVRFDGDDEDTLSPTAFFNKASWCPMDDENVGDVPDTGMALPMSIDDEVDSLYNYGPSLQLEPKRFTDYDDLIRHGPQGIQPESPRFKDDDFMEEIGDISAYLSQSDSKSKGDDAESRPRTPLKIKPYSALKSLKKLPTPSGLTSSRGSTTPFATQMSLVTAPRGIGNALTDACTNPDNFTTPLSVAMPWPIDTPCDVVDEADGANGFAEELVLDDNQRYIVLEL